jgi:ATP-dependent DNA ligase
MRRFRRKHAVAATVEEVPVQLHLFDLLYVNGRSLIDAPCRERWAALEQAAGGLHLVRRLLPQTVEEGAAFAEAAYHDGHEGVMAKDLDSAYTPGVRGKSWLKLKHVVSLDWWWWPPTGATGGDMAGYRTITWPCATKKPASTRSSARPSRG